MPRPLLLSIASIVLAVAPSAHASVTVNIAQICAEDAPQLIPMIVFAAPYLTCGDPSYWRSTGTVPGLFIAAPPSIHRVMARLHPEAYPVDPVNPWSDWVIP